jgi:hypothetical protein
VGPRSPLYVVNADGTEKHRLTAPGWSTSAPRPGRRTLAFTGVGADIYTAPRRLHRTAQAHLRPRLERRSRLVAGWGRIVFVSGRDDPAHRASDLFVMNADGSGQRHLTHTPGVSELGASWTPSLEAETHAAAARSHCDVRVSVNVT